MAMSSDLICIIITFPIVGLMALICVLVGKYTPSDDIPKTSDFIIPVTRSQLKQSILWTFKNRYQHMPLHVKDFDGGFHFYIKARHYAIHYNPEISDKDTIHTTQESYDELINKINEYHYWLSSHNLETGWPIGGNANNLVEILDRIEGGVLDD